MEQTCIMKMQTGIVLVFSLALTFITLRPQDAQKGESQFSCSRALAFLLKKGQRGDYKDDLLMFGYKFP